MVLILENAVQISTHQKDYLGIKAGRRKAAITRIQKKKSKKKGKFGRGRTIPKISRELACILDMCHECTNRFQCPGAVSSAYSTATLTTYSGAKFPAPSIDLIFILWVVVSWLDPLDVLSILSQIMSVLCLVAPDGTLWMYSGADGLIALLGANDGHCYQCAALPAVLRSCRTASPQRKHYLHWGHHSSLLVFLWEAACCCHSLFIWEVNFFISVFKVAKFV